MARLQLQSAEVLEKVAGFLEFDDLFDLAQTCKWIRLDLEPTVCKTRFVVSKSLRMLNISMREALILMQKKAIKYKKNRCTYGVLEYCVKHVLKQIKTNPCAFLGNVVVEVPTGRVELRAPADLVLSLVIAFRLIKYGSRGVLQNVVHDVCGYLFADPEFYLTAENVDTWGCVEEMRDLVRKVIVANR